MVHVFNMRQRVSRAPRTISLLLHARGPMWTPHRHHSRTGPSLLLVERSRACWRRRVRRDPPMSRETQALPTILKDSGKRKLQVAHTGCQRRCKNDRFSVFARRESRPVDDHALPMMSNCCVPVVSKVVQLVEQCSESPLFGCLFYRTSASLPLFSGQICMRSSPRYSWPNFGLASPAICTTARAYPHQAVAGGSRYNW